MSETKQNLEEFLFEAALAKSSATERAAFLDGACRDNPALRARLDLLLEGHFAGQGFLAQTPKRAAAPPVVPSVTELAPLPAEASAQMLGRYKLLEKIGEGGFGEVWMAEQREPVKRRVALKLIKLGMDSRQIVARFEAERQALAMMDHANIAKIFDADVTDTGRPYFVMELVRGIKITEYCDQNQLPTKERLDLFIKVCQAIQHAHQKGIIHRDIKPSNILVTLHDGVPVPKVIDFGIAKATQQELTDKTVFTQFQQFIGTPAYISPEQAEMSGLDIDTRADIYSLGVLLYELLVGQTPFDAKEMMQGGLDALRQIIREKEPLRPSTKLNTMEGDARTTAGKRRQTDVGKLVHQLQGDLDWIVMKCLEKDRTRRYETANGLAADLKRHLDNEPVTARPPSVAYKLQKAWQRNKLAFTAGVAVALALVVGISVSTWQAFAATRARSAAQTAQALAQSKQKEAEAERQRADTQARKASASEQHSRRLLYAADMNLAQQSLKLNNLGKARQLLDRYRPQSGEEDLRGWEWRYLWQLTRSSALVTLTNRPVRGFDVSFSPDGSRLAVGWYDGHVDLWNVPGRRWIRDLATGPLPPQGRVAFSPVSNLLATTSESKAVTLYDLDSGKESLLWRASDQGAPNVRNLAFSKDGSKLVIYAGDGRPDDEIWVVNVVSSQIEYHHRIVDSNTSYHHGAALLSPDNRRLYVANSHFSRPPCSISCIDLVTNQEFWRTEDLQDEGVLALAISPDGQVLTSGSGFQDPAIRVWDAATGRLLVRLDGHAASVCKLTFTGDGRRLISAAADQSIRIWNTDTWTEAKVLRGHTDEVHAVAISESAQLIASAGKDGNLILWQADEKSAADGYSLLPEGLSMDRVWPMDRSRVLLLPRGQTPEVKDLRRDSPAVPLPEIGTSSDFLGWFDTNILCHWNGSNQILIREWRSSEFVQRGAVTLHSATRPAGCAYDATRQLLAWSEKSSPTTIYLTSLSAPSRRIELTNEVSGLVPFQFSEGGKYLAARKAGPDFLRVWKLENRQVVASIKGNIHNPTFAAGGRVLVAFTASLNEHEIQFYDLTHPGDPPKRVSGRHDILNLKVSKDGSMVAVCRNDGHVILYDPVKAEPIGDLHGHLMAAFAIGFSVDGRRLISTSSGRDAVKLWDTGTMQELLTLNGIGAQAFSIRWSADEDVIFLGAPWQAWRAPSWEEIAAAEAKDTPQTKQR